jgi:hypothetical protein
MSSHAAGSLWSTFRRPYPSGWIVPKFSQDNGAPKGKGRVHSEGPEKQAQISFTASRMLPLKATIGQASV